MHSSAVADHSGSGAGSHRPVPDCQWGVGVVYCGSTLGALPASQLGSVPLVVFVVEALVDCTQRAQVVCHVLNRNGRVVPASNAVCCSVTYVHVPGLL